MGYSFCSDGELVEPQSFSFSNTRAHSWTVTQEEMRFEGSQVKALPLSRKRMMPPTPLQHSYSSFEEEQGHFEVEGQVWSARDRTVIARTKQYLEESKSLKVEVEELESLLGPDEARDKKVARYLRPSAQVVRVNSWQSVERDGTSTNGG